MPTAVTHAFAALALGRTAISTRAGWPFWGASLACSLLPDLDVGLFFYGVSYASRFGHRGVIHGIPFAVAAGVLVGWLMWRRRWLPVGWGWWVGGLYFTALLLLHSFLDALTAAEIGLAWWSPFSATRYHFPWQPIPIAPFYPDEYLSREGWRVIRTEALYMWLPAAGIVVAGWLGRKLLSRRHSAPASERE